MSLGINDYSSDLSPMDLFKLFFSRFSGYINPDDEVLIYDYSATNVNLIFLYVLTLLKCKIYYNEKEYELSFAYAIPVKRDESIQNFITENLELCLNSKQVVFLPTETLYLYNKIPYKGLSRIIHDERKTINRNSTVNIEEVEFSEFFFEFWKRFDYKRFSEKQSQSFQDFFKRVYTALDFRLYQYSVESQVVAYNVCYYSTPHNVLYDVLFPWEHNEKSYRIGIYSMIVNIMKAYEMGWGYSICYGIYDYKNAVLSKLVEK